jgi:hypothetical protein
MQNLYRNRLAERNGFELSVPVSKLPDDKLLHDDIADHNRVEFANAIAAEKAGYRGAYNCP